MGFTTTKVSSAVCVTVMLAAGSVLTTSLPATAGPPRPLVAQSGAPSSVEETQLRNLERAFSRLGTLSDAEVARIATTYGPARLPRETSAYGIPMPGPAAIVQCALSAAWIFKGGANSNTIIRQVAEVVVACVGIPATSWVIIRVARLVWKYRTKIAAALTAMGLTAAQVAPIVRAPYPG